MRNSQMSGIRINVEDVSNGKREDFDLEFDEVYGTSDNKSSNNSSSIATAVPTTHIVAVNNVDTGDAGSRCSWHIPRPSLLGRNNERDSETGTWTHHHRHQLHPNSPSRGSTSSQGSTASTHSAASGTLLLTAANLATLASIHPPSVTTPKPMDTASVASSTHFTVINGVGRPARVYKKSWCARNQLTVLVCTMSFLFMIALLAAVLYLEVRARDKYD